MKGMGRYTVIIYLILMLVFLLITAKSRAEDSSVNVEVKNSIMKALTDIIITCHGETFYSTVKTDRLKESLKDLEAWADRECNGSKK